MHRKEKKRKEKKRKEKKRKEKKRKEKKRKEKQNMNVEIEEAKHLKCRSKLKQKVASQASNERSEIYNTVFKSH